nr:MAG TPA: hypothetical protein [Caudoviricetes sp.]
MLHIIKKPHSLSLATQEWGEPDLTDVGKSQFLTMFLLYLKGGDKTTSLLTCWLAYP